MKLARRLFVLTAFLAFVTGIHAWWVWSPKAPTYPLSAESLAVELPVRLRSPDEHDRVRAGHEEAYVLELEKGHGALLYYGAHHSSDPDDPQLEDIRRRWDAFVPTVALCEGRKRGHFLGPILPRLVGLPESALVHRLALREGVPLWSLEPEYATEVARLLETFEPVDVALYFTLRVYWSESGGESDESLAEHLRAKRTDVDGLRGALPDVAALDRAWRRSSPEGDWRTWTVDFSTRPG